MVWETIGGEIFETLFHRLARRGRMVIVGGVTGYKDKDGVALPTVDVDFWNTKILMKSLSVTGFFLFDYKQEIPKYLGDLVKMVMSGELKVATDFGDKSTSGRFTGVQSIVNAVDHLQSGRNSGKVIVEIQK